MAKLLTLPMQSALIFILITICLDSIGLGIIIPSFPTLISQTAHVPLGEASQYFGWMMYAIILPYAFTGIVDPALRSIVSGQVQSNEQGELQGIFTSLMSLGEIIGPPLFMWFYYHFKSSVPHSNIGLSTPFWIAAFIGLLAYLLISWTLKSYSDAPSEEESSNF